MYESGGGPWSHPSFFAIINLGDGQEEGVGFDPRYRETDGEFR